MVNKCSVLLCKSRKHNIKKYSIFQAPKNKDISELWSKIISQVNHKQTNAKYLCELHSSSEDVIRNYSGWGMGYYIIWIIMIIIDPYHYLS